MVDLGSLNSTEIRILEFLKKRRGVDGRTISKLTRIPEFTVKNVLSSLVKRGLVEEDNGLFRITSAGFDVLRRL